MRRSQPSFSLQIHIVLYFSLRPVPTPAPLLWIEIVASAKPHEDAAAARGDAQVSSNAEMVAGRRMLLDFPS